MTQEKGDCYMEKENQKGLRTVHRAIRLLNCFTLEDPELSLTVISEKIQLPKSTTARIIDTLIETEMLQRNAHNFNYKLGYNLYILGRVAEQSNDIVRLSSPIMVNLREDTGESVSLYKMVSDKRICIERFMSKQPVSHNVSVGSKLELDKGSAGKALIAFQDEKFIDKIVMKQTTDERKKWLLSEIQDIKKIFISRSYDERGAGVNAISSPIFDVTGRVRYALCLSGPSMRFSNEMMHEFEDRVQTDAFAISKLVGYEG